MAFELTHPAVRDPIIAKRHAKHRVSTQNFMSVRNVMIPNSLRRYATILRNLFAVSSVALPMMCAYAAPYPAKAVHVIVPFAPGGIADVTARIVGAALSVKWGEPVVIDNRPGAGSNVGAVVAAQARPDGYTIFEMNVANTIAVSLYKNRAYDVEADFVPVTELASSPFVLVASPTLHITRIADLIAMAKAKPNQLTFGSSGDGSASHLLMALLTSMAGIKMTHVPYTSSSTLESDLISGRINTTFSTPSSVMNLVHAGKNIALGISSPQSAFGIPAISESGVPGFEGSTWVGLALPKGTPDDITKKLNADVIAVLNDPAVRKRILAQGLQPVGDTPSHFAAFIHSEVARWRHAVAVSGATIK